MGENIAWDFSFKGSPAGEFVLREYNEIFGYNRNDPVDQKQRHPTGVHKLD